MTNARRTTKIVFRPSIKLVFMLGTSHYVRHTTNIHTHLSILIFEEPNRKHILLSRLLSLINIILCYQMLGNFHSPSTAPCLQHCSILFVFTVNRLIQNGKHTHKKNSITMSATQNTYLMHVYTQEKLILMVMQRKSHQLEVHV